MEIVFISSGCFNSKIELFFQSLQHFFPDIKRVHGLSKEDAYKMAALITDTDSFIAISAQADEFFIPETLNELMKYYPVIQKKNIIDKYIPFGNKKQPDIVYLTYNENNAEDNFENLLKKYPNLKRLHRVKGLSRAFRNVAEMVESSYYVLIDGDNLVLDEFDLYSVTPPLPNEMHFYMTRNPVNDLVYGYGGIKSCPTENFRRIQNDKIDPIASGGILKTRGIKEIASITNFNTSPFNAWKAGFREVVMLLNQDPELKMDYEKIQAKIEIWKTKGKDRPVGKFTIAGAKDGENYGLKHKGQHELLFKINDPDFLKRTFIELGYVDTITL